jgi:hypothetical protein
LAARLYWPFFTDEFVAAHDGRVFAPLAEVVTTALLRLAYNIAHGLLPPAEASIDTRYVGWVFDSGHGKITF